MKIANNASKEREANVIEFSTYTKCNDHAKVQRQIIKKGTCYEVIDPDVLRKVFQIDAVIGEDPRTKKPICITYDLIKIPIIIPFLIITVPNSFLLNPK